MTKQTSNELSSNTAYSPEREIAKGLRMNPWATVVWWKRHPTGPVATVWHLRPLHLYVAGWVPIAGRLVLPRLVDGDFMPDQFLADLYIDELGCRVFERGPTEELIAHTKQIADAYAESGRKGGRGKRRGKTTSEPAWPTQFPGYSFHMQKGEVTLRGPSGPKILVRELVTGSEAKDLAWWNLNGPSKAMVNKYSKFVAGLSN